MFKSSTDHLPGEELITPLGRGSGFEGAVDGGVSAGYRWDRVGKKHQHMQNNKT